MSGYNEALSPARNNVLLLKLASMFQLLYAMNATIYHDIEIPRPKKPRHRDSKIKKTATLRFQDQKPRHRDSGTKTLRHPEDN